MEFRMWVDHMKDVVFMDFRGTLIVSVKPADVFDKYEVEGVKVPLLKKKYYERRVGVTRMAVYDNMPLKPYAGVAEEARLEIHTFFKIAYATIIKDMPELADSSDFKYLMKKFELRILLNEESVYAVFDGGIDWPTSSSWNIKFDINNKKLGPIQDTGVNAELSALSRMLPGINARVRPPCFVEGSDCPWYTHYNNSGQNQKKVVLRETIMHLNDEHKWTREAIADWIETLDVDTTFRIPEGEENGTD